MGSISYQIISVLKETILDTDVALFSANHLELQPIVEAGEFDFKNEHHRYVTDNMYVIRNGISLYEVCLGVLCKRSLLLSPKEITVRYLDYTLLFIVDHCLNMKL